MRRLFTIWACLLAGLAFAQPAVAETVYVHAGRLLDRPGEQPRGASTVIVTDGVVERIEDGLLAPPTGVELVDLADRLVMPGFIDLHVHLLGIDGDPLQARLVALTNDSADDLLIGVGNARDTLMAGFTTVRDLGGEARSIRALREAIERGDVAGPTIVNAGEAISVTGGHGDSTNGAAELFAEALGHAYQNICDGPDDCRRAVRRQVGLGAQVIKFMATGGVLSNVSGGLGRAMTPEEMSAVIETAHGLGRKVAAHSHAAAGTRAAVDAGVDSIEHGTFLDDETIAAMKRHGTWLVPTMLAVQTVSVQADEGALPAAVVPKVREAVQAQKESHARAIAAGVKVAFGTDSGVSRHGDNAKEFALMVEAGMTPMQAIRAATRDAAEVLGMADRWGVIAPGREADLVSAPGNPLSDAGVLERIDFVMQDGAVVRRPDSAPPQ